MPLLESCGLRSRTRLRPLMLLGLLMVGRSAAAQAPAGEPRAAHPLAGTWTLEAADDIRPDGVRVAAYGPAPRGLLIVDAAGRYSLQIFRRDRPRFASGDKKKGTALEYQEAVLGMSSHVGEIVVDSVARVLTFRIALASYPNWEGTEQRRSYELAGDTLTYRLPVQAGSNGNIPLSSWRRVASGSPSRF